MLPIGTGLSPNNGTGLNLDSLAVVVNVLAVGLHVALLKVGSKAVHVLVVRENGKRFGAKEAVVATNAVRSKCVRRLIPVRSLFIQ